MLSLTLLRHGAVDERPFVLWGQLDPPLSARGRADMQRTLERMPQNFAGIISSPLQRCRHFAQDLAQAQAIDLQVEADLMELDFGAWQGLTPVECLERDGERYRAFQNDPEQVAPPQGESLPAFRVRVLSLLSRWRAQASDGHWLCVTHGGVQRVLLTEWASLRDHWRVALPPASALRFSFYPDCDPLLVSITSPGED